MASADPSSRTLAEGAERLAREVVSLWSSADRATFVRYLGAILRHVPELARERTLGPADRAMGGRIRFRAPGGEIELPGSLIGAAREMYGRGVYFVEPACCPRRGDVVVDLGANIGLFSLGVAGLAARVVAVEAQSGFVPRIIENLAANRLREKVSILCAFVGAGGKLDQPGELERASAFEGQRPERLTLDELCAREKLDRIDLLKLDIEGSEFALFEAPGAWLDRVDRIVMEVHGGPAGDPQAVASTLRQRGFTVVLRGPDSRPCTSLTGVGYLFAHR